jgi:glutamate formiminotransferase
MKIIECVPNFSEGKNKDTFDAISDSVKNIRNVKLLSIEPDADYNRVVVTLAGDEVGILHGTLAACKAAAEMIDMRNHHGEHPRLGAIDVVPFVPVKNVTMKDCVKIAERFGDLASKGLKIPVYLYEEASRKPTRKLLSNIRKGEYEGLEAKLTNLEWLPDFGEPIFNPKSGAIVTGARFFLIAYNINIKSTEVQYAKEIAELLRESGKIKRDVNGIPVKINGETIRIPGKLPTVQGMGVLLEKYNISQVSMNLKNFNITSLHTAFEAVKEEAARLGVKVEGSEIVGLVPLEAVLQAGRFYSNGSLKDEKDLVKLAVEKLGLSTLNPFIPEQKIIDYMI